MSHVERELVIVTSVDGEPAEFEPKILDKTLGAVRLDLLASVPMSLLNKCAQVVARPSWESTLQSTLFSALSLMMVCVFIVSFFEADRLLKINVAEMGRGTPVAPTLDFRQFTNTKTSLEERSQKSKKEEDWKRSKDKVKQSPDWNVDEERKFKEENAPVIKKKATRKQNVVEPENVTENRDEKKNVVVNGNLSRKKKAETYSAKEEYKLPADEALYPNVTETQNKETNHKKKQYTEVQMNNTNFKKYYNTSHKIAHYSEEETSSTTTEGSAQEETVNTTNSGNGSSNKYKDYSENAKVKDDKHLRNLHTEKSKSASSIPASSADFKDNYKGDCDDDEYDKDKSDNSER